VKARKSEGLNSFMVMENLDWEKATDYWLKCEKVDTNSTRKKGSDKYVPKKYLR